MCEPSKTASPMEKSLCRQDIYPCRCQLAVWKLGKVTSADLSWTVQVVHGGLEAPSGVKIKSMGLPLFSVKFP